MKLAFGIKINTMSWDGDEITPEMEKAGFAIPIAIISMALFWLLINYIESLF